MNDIDLSTIKTGIVLMTPEMAELILLRNTKNRKLREKTVNNISKIILNGEWITTHQGVAISNEGVLLDGQHRLAGIIKANTPVEIMLTTGVNANAFMAIDRGLARSNSDVTNINRKDVEVIAFLIRHLFSSSKPTAQSMISMHEKIADYMTLVKGTSVTFSSTPFRAAAILQSISCGLTTGGYARESYSTLVNSDVSGATGILSTALKHKLSGKFSSSTKRGGSLQAMHFKLAMFIFDKKNKDRHFLKYSGDSIDIYDKEAINILAKVGVTKDFIVGIN